MPTRARPRVMWCRDCQQLPRRSLRLSRRFWSGCIPVKYIPPPPPPALDLDLRTLEPAGFLASQPCTLLLPILDVLQGLNSIESQQFFNRVFILVWDTLVVLKTLLKILLKSLLRFN